MHSSFSMEIVRKSL